jgi:hypothetical protein
VRHPLIASKQSVAAFVAVVVVVVRSSVALDATVTVVAVVLPIVGVAAAPVMMGAVIEA